MSGTGMEPIPPAALRPRVYVQASHQPPRTAESWVEDMVRAAGGEPFMPAPGSLNREISWEELMEFDPQLVIYCGLERAPEEFLKVEGWDRTEAARLRQVFSVNADLFNESGPRLLEGGRLLQGLIGEAYWGWDKVVSDDLRRLV